MNAAYTWLLTAKKEMESKANFARLAYEECSYKEQPFAKSCLALAQAHDRAVVVYQDALMKCQRAAAVETPRD